MTLSQKKLPQNRAGGVAQGVGPEFKPQYREKKKIVVVLKTKSALGMVVHAYNPSNSTGRGRRLTSLRPCDHMTRPCLKKTKS
jgi:hypothetical protein